MLKKSNEEIKERIRKRLHVNCDFDNCICIPKAADRVVSERNISKSVAVYVRVASSEGWKKTGDEKNPKLYAKSEKEKTSNSVQEGENDAGAD